MSVQYIPGGRKALDTVTMPYRNDFEIKNPHEILKDWIGDDVRNKNYTLFRTSANKSVDTLLGNAGLGDRGNFSTGLLEYFHSYMKTVLGKDYFSYPYIHFIRTGNQDPFHPQVHILKGRSNKQQIRFRELVENLLTDTAFQHYRKLDKPQNYQQGRLNTLLENRDTLSSPLIVLPEIATFSGREMKNIADFLMPYSVVFKSSSDNYD